MKAQRITLVTSSLTLGGAEKNVALLANEFTNRGKTMTVISFDRHPPFFHLDPAVTLVKTDITRGYNNLFADAWTTPSRLSRLRREIIQTKPDLIISFMDINNLLTLLTTRGLGIPVIVAERSDPRIWPIQKGWRMMRSILYPSATRIVTQTLGAKRFFPESLQAKIVAIPNPVLTFTLPMRLPEKLKEKRILSTARLVAMKRFDLLIRAFSALQQDFRDWTLDILGDGEERLSLEKLRNDLGVGKSVYFRGPVKDPETYLQKASLFVLCSDFEGFPNALAEALAAGVPVITTDTQGGRELIEPEKNGLIVPVRDLAGLTAALAEMMGSLEMRERMSAQALVKAQTYSLDSVLGKWEDAFASI